jgi:hypothetical protein
MVELADVKPVSSAVRAMPKSIRYAKSLRQQDVGRLDVAVHQPDLMGAVHCRGDLLDDVDCAVGIEWAGVQEALKFVTGDQPHGDIEPAVDLADVVNRYDVGIVEPRGHAGLTAEALFEDGVLGVTR